MNPPKPDSLLQWDAKTLRPSLQKSPERKKFFATDSGVEVERLYVSHDMNYEDKLGFPGQFPFTRGIYPTMYRNKLWTMRQYAGFGTAEKSNERYKYLISHGTTGLSVAFDLPTQMGYDSDHVMAEGEVGKVGVAIDSLADMEVLFEGIRVQDVTTSMTINATAAILLCMYVALARKQSADLRRISGTVQNDILKEYIARGTYIYPPVQSMRLVTDLMEWCAKEIPRWNAISISGYHIREAGATAVQELAFSLANAIAYVEASLRRGLQVDEFGGQISFFFNAHNNFFEEIAKFRAARRMWAHIMKTRFHAQRPETMKLRFHAQTGGATLAAQQVDNNVVRVTTQAMAAVLGGCQSLHTNSRDEALALPTEEAAKLALRTQQVLAFESGVADTVDPLGGSYFVERLTDSIEERVKDYLEKVEKMGGALKAIELNFFQKEIAESAYRYQQAIEKKEKIIVGVNEFADQSAGEVQLLEVDQNTKTRQVERLAAVRRRRNAGLVRKALDELEKQSKGSGNIVPHILAAVEQYATVGEISDVFRRSWGEHRNE